VNTAAVDGIAIFVVVGDPDSQHLKSFWYKVHCKVCGDMMLLCPPKKNLKSNLEAHIHGLRHTKVVEVALALSRSASLALSTGRRGRPAASTRLVIGGQPSLHGWFKVSDLQTQSQSVSTATGQVPSILASLCWDYWRSTTSYNSQMYNVSGLLHDPHKDKQWVCELETRIDFSDGKDVRSVQGCFRHVKCHRLSTSREPFPNFTCSECEGIPREGDFKKRVLRQSRNILKRGKRTTSIGIRIGYLSTIELGVHSRILMKRFRDEKAMHWSMRA
jgi:hypothetical protein